MSEPSAGAAPYAEEALAIEAFDRSLERGSERLQRGDPRGAVDALEDAVAQQPHHQRARNLLGLALFKLGDLARSEHLYRGLIEDHPEDATLRVNLGLVFLKSGAFGDAVRCFETAVDLQPGHAKAHNYLGLALAQLGEFARARGCFEKAGNAPMAEKMAQSTGSPLQAVAEAAELRLQAPQPFQAAAEAVHTPPQATPVAVAVIGAIKPKSGWVVATPQGTEAPDRSRPITLTDARPVRPAAEASVNDVHNRPPSQSPVESPPPIPSAPMAEDRGAGHAQPPPPPPAALGNAPSALADYTNRQRITVPTGEAGFSIGPTEVVVHVAGEMLTRLDGLVASWGSMAVRPELKRFRGKATDKPFGEGARRMLRATGHGRFVISRETRQFTALELGDEPAYFREEVLFSFEESLLFENGRVPSRSGADLHLVHLRGHGRLLLSTHGRPRSAEVVKGEPLRIPMDQLVGWHGPNIQPRLVPICDEAPELGVALELSGEGRALVDSPDDVR